MVTLGDVKNALGITGDYQDATLQEWMDEVVAVLEAPLERNIGFWTQA